jgi:hypothetical protein
MRDSRVACGHPLSRPCATERASVERRRNLATCYEKRAVNYRALVIVASSVIWLGS